MDKFFNLLKKKTHKSLHDTLELALLGDETEEVLIEMLSNSGDKVDFIHEFSNGETIHLGTIRTTILESQWNEDICEYTNVIIINKDVEKSDIINKTIELYGSNEETEQEYNNFIKKWKELTQ